MKRAEPLETYSSDRTFQLWAWTVSHGQLLLRSTRTDDEPTRIDVYFKGVRHLNLPRHMHGLHLTKVADDRIEASGRDWSGEVGALWFQVAVDDGEYGDPSSLWQGGIRP